MNPWPIATSRQEAPRSRWPFPQWGGSPRRTPRRSAPGPRIRTPRGCGWSSPPAPKTSTSWPTGIGRRLDVATGRPISGDIFATIGFNPAVNRVLPGGPLAVSTMAGIAETIAAVVRRWCPSVAAARRAVETAWFEPDPVALARPLADLPDLFERLVPRGPPIARSTTHHRPPTAATLRA